MINQTTLLDVFSLFTKDDKDRPALMAPFEINGKVYATDYHTLIRCDKSHCDFEINNPHKNPNCEAVMPLETEAIVLKVEKSVFEKYKTEDEVKYIGGKNKCKACDGFGEVEWEFQNHTKSDDCPVCDGDGYEDKRRSVKTGNKTFGNQVVKIKKTYFKVDIFYKLIKAQEHFGGDITLISKLKIDSGVMFKVGFCEIILMPYAIGNADHFDDVLNISFASSEKVQ